MNSEHPNPTEYTRKIARGDNPIKQVADDALGRAPAARAFAGQVLDQDASEGVVVGVLGPWGSGKTSFFNLSRPVFDKAGVPILEFNPWMFSGAQQLVESFFMELAAQLRLRPGLAQLGDEIADYGEIFSGLGWLPLVGSWIERLRLLTKVAREISKRRKEGIGARRVKIEKALSKLDKPIVVFLDDIDRLSTEEIRDIFKLIRLTASFPNLIYVVAFDRIRVEEALADKGIPGRDYLEKILQVVVDLPVIPEDVLVKQVASFLDDAIANIEHPGPFDEQVWPDVFAEIVRPLLRNMRDVRRYVAAVKGTVTALEGQIALVDVFALEAVRLFLPDVFGGLQDAVSALTTTATFGTNRDDSPDKAKIKGLVEIGGGHEEVVRALITRLFPAAQRHNGGSHYSADWEPKWLQERRVAHADIFRLYLERIVGERLGNFRLAEKAWARFSDRNALDVYLRSIDKARLQDVIGLLEMYEDKFRPDQVVPATIVLLNLSAEIPEEPRRMFAFGSRIVVDRVILRLLRILKDPSGVEAAVRQILPALGSLSLKLQLILLVGHRKDIGHKLISEATAKEFEKSWRDDVRNSTPADLIKERDIGAVLLTTKRDAGDPSEPPLLVPKDPEFTLALLRCARTETLSQSLGSRAVRRRPRLSWDALVETYGDEETLRERIEALRQAKLEGISDLLELADKYLSGWRPNIFTDD